MVIRITGRCGLVLCRVLITSKPLEPGGILKSVTTTSNSFFRVAAIPCSPLSAEWTLCPSASRICRSAARTCGESSISKILAMRCSVLENGQFDAEGGSLSNLSIKIQRAPVLVDDARGDGQPQPRSILFRAEERIEELLLHFGRNACAGILHFQKDRIIEVFLGARPAPAGAQDDGAVLADAVRRILNQVNQHLLELLPVGAKRRVHGGIEF